LCKKFGKESNVIFDAHVVEGPAAFRKYYKSCKNTKFGIHNKMKRAITYNVNIKKPKKIGEKEKARVGVEQCFSTAGPRPGTGPWLQLYRDARGFPGVCHFSFLSIFND
jgi:hypothetical protein